MADSSFTNRRITVPITPANGGTGRKSLTDKAVIVGAGTGKVNFVAPGASGNALTSDGINWTSATSAVGDGTVSYPKLAPDLVDSLAIPALNIDWSSDSVFTKTLTESTTFTFSNYQLNKTVTLIITGDYAR